MLKNTTQALKILYNSTVILVYLISDFHIMKPLLLFCQFEMDVSNISNLYKKKTNKKLANYFGSSEMNSNNMYAERCSSDKLL